MPRLFIISGCNGSGKTTASYALLPEMLGCSQFVNSDEFAKSFSPFNPESAYVAASRYMLMKIRYLFKRKDDFCIETTLAARSLLKMLRRTATMSPSCTSGSIPLTWRFRGYRLVSRREGTIFRKKPSGDATTSGCITFSGTSCRCATNGFLSTIRKCPSLSLPKVLKTA